MNVEDDVIEQMTQPETEGRGLTIDDFVAYMPMHSYIFTPCREIWAGASVNARLPRMPLLDQHGLPLRNAKGELIALSPTLWLDKNRPVEQMTWCPRLPMLIADRLVVAGGWIERPEVTFNLYRPSRLELGNAALAERWLAHVRAVYDEDDAAHVTAGWRTRCSGLPRRSTTRSSWAVRKALARLLYSNRSSTRSALGTAVLSANES
jgi:hypothetical protein